MNLSQLQKITTTPKKRAGQGHGSGRVKTSGRGTKGQNARNKVGVTLSRYSGGSLGFVKSLPFLRGKGRNYSLQMKTLPINLSDLNVFAKGEVVDLKTLVEKKVVTSKAIKNRPVKILGDGEVSVALTVKLPVSKSAQEKIEKAGGTVAL